MTKWSKGLTLPMSDIRFGQKRADLVCEWDAVGHLFDVLLRVEVIPLVKAPAQLWVETRWCQCDSQGLSAEVCLCAYSDVFEDIYLF